MRRQVKRTLFVVAAIFMLIFGQLQVAAYACERAQVSASDQEAAMVAMQGDMAQDHASTPCQLHCDNAAQPDHTPQPAVSPVVWLPVIWGLSHAGARPTASTQPARASEPSLLYPPPPSRILFQVFRT